MLGGCLIPLYTVAHWPGAFCRGHPKAMSRRAESDGGRAEQWVCGKDEGRWSSPLPQVIVLTYLDLEFNSMAIQWLTGPYSPHM